MMKKYLFALVSVSAMFFAACDDDNSTAPIPDNPSSQAIEAQSSSSHDKGSSDSKNSTVDSTGSRISPDNVISVVKGTVSEDKSKKSYLVTLEDRAECRVGGTKKERTVAWEKVENSSLFTPTMEFDGEKLILREDSTFAYVFEGGPAPKIDGMWTLDSIWISQDNVLYSFDDRFDATLEISHGKFVMTLGLKEIDDDSLGKATFGGSNPIFPRSDFINKMYQALNGDRFSPLYMDDVTNNYTELHDLFTVDSLGVNVTMKASKDSSVTFVLNGTTYTVTLDSFVQRYYEGNEVVISVKKDDTVCKWHQKEKNVTQELCKTENLEHLNEDKNVYSLSGQIVTKYWEGNRAEFVECLKGIATPAKK